MSGIAENFRPNLAGKSEKHKKKKVIHTLSLSLIWVRRRSLFCSYYLSLSVSHFILSFTHRATNKSRISVFSLSLCFFFEFVRRVRSVQLWPSFRSWGESSSLPFSFSLLIKSKPLDLLISFTVFLFVCFVMCSVWLLRKSGKRKWRRNLWKLDLWVFLCLGVGKVEAFT